MCPRPIRNRLPEIAAAASVKSQRLDAALLGVNCIVTNLQERGFTFRIEQYPSPALDRLGSRAFCAKIEHSKAQPSRGYSLGAHDDISVLALFEAFERNVFRSVLEPDPCPEFSASRLLTGEATTLPRRLVVGEEGVYPSTTSGMACHTSHDAALLAACLEIHERNILLREWFSGRAPDRVSPPDCAAVRWIRELTEGEGFELITGIYCPSDGTPVAVAGLISTAHRMAFIGTGAALTATSAIEKACREALTVWIFDFMTWQDSGSLEDFDPENQIRRHHDNFDSIRGFFDDIKRGRQKDATLSRAPLEILESVFREYDFSVIPIPINRDKKLPNEPVLIRAYSPNAIPLFHGDFPLLLPDRFDILRTIKNPEHPY